MALIRIRGLSARSLDGFTTLGSELSASLPNLGAESYIEFLHATNHATPTLHSTVLR